MRFVGVNKKTIKTNAFLVSNSFVEIAISRTELKPKRILCSQNS